MIRALIPVLPLAAAGAQGVSTSDWWSLGLWVGGVVVAAIAFLFVRWMDRQDKFRDSSGRAITELQKQAALSEQDRATMHDQFSDLMKKLDAHIAEEPKYWRENAERQAEILSKLSSLEYLKDHVEDHNREAEDWKRRIVAIESEIKKHHQ